MNKRLKKIAILSALNAALLSGCAKSTNDTKNTENISTEMTTIETYEEEIPKIVSNQTIAQIHKKYEEKLGENIDIKNLQIIEFDTPSFVWNKGDKYIYDYRINGYNNEEYAYVEPGYYSKIYAVIDNNVPICALFRKDNEIYNIEVTYAIDNNRIYEPSENYIYIENPDDNNFNELGNALEYISVDEEHREPAIEKEAKKVIILK